MDTAYLLWDLAVGEGDGGGAWGVSKHHIFQSNGNDYSEKESG